MLGERFRANFFDFDAGGQPWSPCGKGIVALAQDDVRALYAPTAVPREVFPAAPLVPLPRAAEHLGAELLGDPAVDELAAGPAQRPDGHSRSNLVLTRRH